MAKSNLEIVVGLTDNTRRGLSSITGSLGKLGKIAAGVALVGVTALAGGLTALAVTSIPAASDLEESINKVNVVFGDASESVHKFAADAATGLGQSQAQALEAAGTYGNLLTSIGLATDQAADMSIEMVTLASDLASFNNASPEETLLALRSALTGEFEPMKRFGTALNQAAVEAKALELGLIKTKDELTPAIKAQAAYALILEQTTNAQGDFARTSEGLANAQRVVKAQMEDLRATIGKFLLPIAEKFFGFLSKTAIPSLKNIIDLFATGDFTGGIFGLTEDHPFILFLLRVRELALDFRTLINVIAEFGVASESAKMALQNMFGEEVGTQIFNVINTVVELGQKLNEFVQNVVIPFVRDHSEEFKGALIAIGAVIFGVIPAISIIGAVIGALTSPITLIIAAVALLGAAWAGNWGGIRDRLTEVWNKVQPILSTLWTWLQNNLPTAMQILTDYWSLVLLPAIQAVWQFLSVDMMPIWEALAELLSVTVGFAVKALTELWNDGLKPALETVWDFIKTYVIPIFQNLSTSVGGVSGVIETVVGWINSLSNAIRNLPSQLPSWLRRQSPSPFELVFINSEAALKSLNQQLPKLKAAMDFGALGGGMGTGGLALAGHTIVGGDTTINNHFYDEGSAALGLALTRKGARDRLNASMGR